MALTWENMKISLIVEMDAAFGVPPNEGGVENRDKLCEAIARAVVGRIELDAVVTVSLQNGQVTSGPGSGGTVTGTSVGSIT